MFIDKSSSLYSKIIYTKDLEGNILETGYYSDGSEKWKSKCAINGNIITGIKVYDPFIRYSIYESENYSKNVTVTGNELAIDSEYRLANIDHNPNSKRTYNVKNANLMSQTTTYKYTKNSGNINRQTANFYKYNYDKNGNWISRMIITLNYYDDKFQKQEIAIEKRTITYR